MRWFALPRARHEPYVHPWSAPRAVDAATLAKSPPWSPARSPTLHARGVDTRRAGPVSACSPGRHVLRAYRMPNDSLSAQDRDRYMNHDEMKQLIQRGFTTLGVRTSVMAGVPTARATPP